MVSAPTGPVNIKHLTEIHLQLHRDPYGVSAKAAMQALGQATSQRLATTRMRRYCTSVPTSTPKIAGDSLSAELSTLTFGLIGPGRVGSSLGHWLVAAGARAVLVCGRHEDRATELARVWGAQAAALPDLGLHPPPLLDLLLVAVPDRDLRAIASQLAGHLEASVALHTSGAEGAGALAPLREAGIAVGSCHPLIAFPEILPDPATASGRVFAIDGDAAATALAARLVRAWKGISVEIPGPDRRLYHAAATLAAGGVTTLLGAAWRLAAAAGLPPEVGRGYLDLAAGALRQATLAEHPSDAITGPAARGDVTASLAAIDAIAHINPAVGELARRLAIETAVQILERRGASAEHERLASALEREWFEAP